MPTIDYDQVVQAVARRIHRGWGHHPTHRPRTSTHRGDARMTHSHETQSVFPQTEPPDIPSHVSSLTRVLAEVRAERERQDAKWGEQNHADGTGDGRHLFREIVRPTYGSLAYLARAHTNRTAEQGTVTFADILLEEVFEALAEDDPARVRAELVQSAAVAVAWVEAIDRRAH